MGHLVGESFAARVGAFSCRSRARLCSRHGCLYSGSPSSTRDLLVFRHFGFSVFSFVPISTFPPCRMPYRGRRRPLNFSTALAPLRPFRARVAEKVRAV